MTYSDMTVEELILLAAEFVGRGTTIPEKIQTILGPDLIRDIQNPETTRNDHQERKRPGHRSGRR